MKDLKDFLLESFNSVVECDGVGIYKKETEEEEQERLCAIYGCESEEEEKERASETITSEESFRDYAKNKFEIVFGDNLDEKKMNDTIDGLLKDNKELVDAENWGELIGILNKSFGA